MLYEYICLLDSEKKKPPRTRFEEARVDIDIQKIASDLQKLFLQESERYKWMAEGVGQLYERIREAAAGKTEAENNQPGSSSEAGGKTGA